MDYSRCGIVGESVKFFVAKPGEMAGLCGCVALIDRHDLTELINDALSFFVVKARELLKVIIVFSFF